MSLPHWEYFLAIENDLEACARYVEFSESNYQTYSLEFARIILACGGEIDSVLKLLCKSIESSENPTEILEYFPIITAKFPKFTEFEIQIPRYRLSVQPWGNWTGTLPPKWWTSYNKIKHKRDTEFKNANLFNTLNAVAGLLCVLLYYYKKEFTSECDMDYILQPRILKPAHYSSWSEATISWTFTTPDHFERF